MPFNGSGTYVLPTNSFNPAVGNTTISSSAWNATAADLAGALSTCLTKDGQTTPTDDIPMGGYKITGAASGTDPGDYVTLGQVQTQTFTGNVVFAAQNSANQGVTSGSPSTLTCAETVDPASCFSASALTAPVTGYYEISGLISAIGTTITSLLVDINKSPSTVMERIISINQPATATATGAGSAVIFATAGDIFNLQVTVTGTGTLELVGTIPRCQFFGRLISS